MTQKTFKILALDPGTDKYGLAVLDEKGQIILRKILPLKEVIPEIKKLIAEYLPKTIVLGKGTGQKEITKNLGDLSVPIVKVEEKFSTLEARRLYWQANPPKGIKRLIPTSLLFPKEPIDDWAAVVIGRKYLEGGGFEPPNS